MTKKTTKRHRNAKPTTVNSTQKYNDSASLKSRKKPRVLIVDDDEFFRNSLVAWFQNEGFDVECTGSVNASIDLVCEKQFDIIVLDMHMPEQVGQPIKTDSGLAMATLLKKYADINRLAVLIVLTGYPSVEDCFTATDVGAYYLPKLVLDIDRHIVNWAKELVRECKLIIHKRSKKPKSRLWMVDYYAEMVNKFPGQAIGVLDKAAETGDIETVSFGECKVVSAPSVEELKMMILQNPLLRKAMPVILEMWKEES